MDFQFFLDVWNDPMEISFFKMFLIGSVLLGMNFGIFLAVWYTRECIAIECGYPIKKYKAIKGKIKRTYSFLQRLFLIKVTTEAPRNSIMLFINLICNFLNILSFVSCVVGYIGCLITLADGWALSLLLFSVIVVLIPTEIVTFIPELLFVPSFRRKYKFWR